VSNDRLGSAIPRPPRYLLSDADLGEEEALAVANVVRSKWLSVGQQTADFESEFADFVECDHAIATSSATASLHLAMLALGIGPGDEVLVPSYTFVASVNAIAYVGATPVFVDIGGPSDLNLDLAELAAKVSPRTRAVIVVHLAGYLADMNGIMDLASRHEFAVVEDAAHAVGARYQTPGGYQGRSAGTIGTLGCFSFFANKNLVTGEGGMTTSDSETLARAVRLGRSHGMTKTSWDKATGRATDYDIDEIGYNYRPTELTSALGRIQLRKLPAAQDRRRALTEHYRRRLSVLPDVVIPFAEHTAGSAYHILPLVLPNREMRGPFRSALELRGVQTSVHYPPSHLFTHYERTQPHTVLPKTEDVASREVTVPLHALLEIADIDQISDLIISAYEETS